MAKKPKPKETANFFAKKNTNDFTADNFGSFPLSKSVPISTLVPPSKELWKQDIQLTEVEAAFRINKEQLDLRPVWPQKEDRVKAHILACFMAYAMGKTLAAWMKRAGLGDPPRTLIKELARIKSEDVSIKAISPDGSMRELLARGVVQPSPEQKGLLNRLGLKVPNHLRRLERLDSKGKQEAIA